MTTSPISWPKCRNFKSPAVSTKNATCSCCKPIVLQPAQFEEDQRNQITLQRLYSIIVDSVQVSDAEVRERYRLDQEKINLQFVKLSANDFVSQVKLTDEDIKKFYDRNKDIS